MSGLPNVQTIYLNTPSVSFHFEDRSNILKFLSAMTFWDPGMWAVKIQSCCSAAHYHMSKAISSHIGSNYPHIINISYCCIVVYHNPNMPLLSLKKLRSPSLAPRVSRVFMCNACSCLVHMLLVSHFSQTASNLQVLHQCILLYLLAACSNFWWLS